MKESDLLENKLTILCIFDAMDMPLEQDNLFQIIVNENSWMKYIEFNQAFTSLIEARMITKTKKGIGSQLYALTQDGRNCLDAWNSYLPLTKREEIKNLIDENIIKYKRNQEITSDYFKNKDGTYSVNLIIKGNIGNIFDLKIQMPTREKARWVSDTWKDKALQIYSIFQDELTL